MSWDPLNDIRYGVEKERAQMTETGLNESAGWWNGMWGNISGATDEGVESKRSAIQSAAAKRDYKELYERTTGKPWKDGMSGGAALSAIDTAKKTESRTDFREQLELTTTASMAPVTAQLEAARIESNANRQSQERQFEYLQNKDDNRFALQNAQRLDDKAEARRERLDLLDRQDHRYAQEMQRYDKRRRQETIQGLVGGLASLGAAFAM